MKPTSFVQACESFQREFLTRQKPSTRSVMASEIKTRLRPAFECHSEIKYLSPEKINEAIEKWIAGGLAPKTIMNLITTLGLIRRHIGLDPFQKGMISIPKNSDIELEAACFTQDEMTQIIFQAKDQAKIIFSLLAETGLRIGEALAIHIEDVDRARSIIHIRRSLFGRQEQSPKTRNGCRWIPLNKNILELLIAHSAGRDSGYLFIDKAGQPLIQATLLVNSLWPILDLLNIPRCGFHAFRHGRVSYLVEQNVPLNLIKSWIGHGSDKMIARYTHHRPEYHLQNLPPSISTK